MKEEHFNTINYENVNSIIKSGREYGLSWIESGLVKNVTYKLKNVGLMCMGCGACVSVCPMDALSFKQDKWGYYRSEINDDQCIQCGKCVSVCPAIKLPLNTNSDVPLCYEFISSDEDILRKSTSGGIFPTLAKQVLSEGGVVFGAAWTDSLSVKHVIIEDEKNLSILQKSKYLQSYTGNIFRRVKEYLESERKVLFSGTPCQVTGLKAYLGKEYDQLLTVDLLCGNAPSVGFFKKYIEDSFPEGISSYQFRYKNPPAVSWRSDIIEAIKKDGSRIINNGNWDDDYQRVYHSHVMCAPHCEKCRYQSFPRRGDISIGDFWGISKYDKEIDSRGGVSLVLLNSEKGTNAFHKASDHSWNVIKQVPLEWIGGNGYSRNGGHNWISPKRDVFYDAILTMPFGKAVNYSLKPNHGITRDIYGGTNTLLQFDYKMMHFRFESAYWEETIIEGKTTLIVKEGKWHETGHYARLPLAGMLQKKPYRLSVKFRIRSVSDVISFHVIDSAGKRLQIVHMENIKGKNDGRHWIEFSKEFIPNTNYYDEFMVGAAQVSGIGNYIMFAYINISEID